MGLMDLFDNGGLLGPDKAKAYAALSQGLGVASRGRTGLGLGLGIGFGNMADVIDKQHADARQEQRQNLEDQLNQSKFELSQKESQQQADYRNAQLGLEKQRLGIDAQRLAKGGDLPAPIQLANEYEKAMTAGNYERANHIAQFAKILDHGVVPFSDVTPPGTVTPPNPASGATVPAPSPVPTVAPAAGVLPGYSSAIQGINAAKASGKEEGKTGADAHVAAVNSNELVSRLKQNIQAMRDINDFVPEDNGALSADQRAYLSQRFGNLPVLGDGKAAANYLNYWNQLDHQQILSGLQQLTQGGQLRGNMLVENMIKNGSSVPANASRTARAQLLSNLEAELNNVNISAANKDAALNGGQSQPYQALPTPNTAPITKVLNGTTYVNHGGQWYQQ